MSFLSRALCSLLVVSACSAYADQTPPAAVQTFNPTPLQREVLGALTGQSEIRPGVKLDNRFTPENRKEARDYLLAILKRIGLDGKTQPYGTAGGENTYAVLSCGKPNAETIVFGAHYDTVRVAPGANDDGSGVVAVLGVAAEMAKVKNRSRDIMFVFFDEEERGLLGSKAFAQMLKDQNTPVHSVETIDQLGWDSNHNRAIELELPYDGGEDLYKRAAAALKLDITMYTTTETGSDHTSFRRLGFKAMGITEEYRHGDTTPFYHKAGDTFETIDFEYIAQTTKLIVQAMTLLVTQS